ncbi:DinB family protein [Nakamurella sp. A5-74]|uniref:DinB family protein n=1 Tax=Nakamurella sp. A5-74 TaxID=3158264 RepID=A0AAU8DRC7_9ACTN
MSVPTTDRTATRVQLDELHRYLVEARGSLLWKIDGLDEYDVRRPLTPSGTNLLGLIKHLTGVELLYLGACFGRISAHAPGWFGQQSAVRSDFLATTDESRDQLIQDYRHACAHADATLAALPDDAVTHAPWLSPEPLGLHRILVHLVTETEHHVGHADIVRELIDGSLGRSEAESELDNTGGGDVPDAEGWRHRYEMVEATARAASGFTAGVR